MTQLDSFSFLPSMLDSGIHRPVLAGIPESDQTLDPFFFSTTRPTSIASYRVPDEDEYGARASVFPRVNYADGAISRGVVPPFQGSGDPLALDPDPFGVRTVRWAQANGLDVSSGYVAALDVFGKRFSRDVLMETEAGRELVAIAEKNRAGTRRGFWEALTDGSWTDFVPFLSLFTSIGKSVSDSALVSDAMHKLQNGEAVTDEELIKTRLFMAKAERESHGTWGATVGGIVRQAPAFVAEFGLSGGLNSWLKAGAVGLAKGSESVLARIGISSVGKRAARIGVEEAIGKKLVATGVAKDGTRKALVDAWQALKSGADGTAGVVDSAVNELLPGIRKLVQAEFTNGKGVSKLSDDMIEKVARRRLQIEAERAISRNGASTAMGRWMRRNGQWATDQLARGLLDFGPRDSIHSLDTLGSAGEYLKEALGRLTFGSLGRGAVMFGEGELVRAGGSAIYGAVTGEKADFVSRAQLGLEMDALISGDRRLMADASAIARGLNFLEYASEHSGPGFTALGRAIKYGFIGKEARRALLDKALNDLKTGAAAKAAGAGLRKDIEGASVDFYAKHKSAQVKAVTRYLENHKLRKPAEDTIANLIDVGSKDLSRLGPGVAEATGAKDFQELLKISVNDAIRSRTGVIGYRTRMQYVLSDIMARNHWGPDELTAAFRRMGYDGIVEEMLEERYNDFTGALLGWDNRKDEDKGLVDNVKEAVASFFLPGKDHSVSESFKQLLAEAVGFAIPMGVRVGLSAVQKGALAGPLAHAGHVADVYNQLMQSPHVVVNVTAQEAFDVGKAAVDQAEAKLKALNDEKRQLSERIETARKAGFSGSADAVAAAARLNGTAKVKGIADDIASAEKELETAKGNFKLMFGGTVDECVKAFTDKISWLGKEYAPSEKVFMNNRIMSSDTGMAKTGSEEENRGTVERRDVLFDEIVEVAKNVWEARSGADAGETPAAPVSLWRRAVSGMARVAGIVASGDIDFGKYNPVKYKLEHYGVGGRLIDQVADRYGDMMQKIDSRVGQEMAEARAGLSNADQLSEEKKNSIRSSVETDERKKMERDVRNALNSYLAVSGVRMFSDREFVDAAVGAVIAEKDIRLGETEVNGRRLETRDDVAREYADEIEAFRAEIARGTLAALSGVDVDGRSAKLTMEDWDTITSVALETDASRPLHDMITTRAIMKLAGMVDAVDVAVIGPGFHYGDGQTSMDRVVSPDDVAVAATVTADDLKDWSAMPRKKVNAVLSIAQQLGENVETLTDAETEDLVRRMVRLSKTLSAAVDECDLTFGYVDEKTGAPKTINVTKRDLGVPDATGTEVSTFVFRDPSGSMQNFNGTKESFEKYMSDTFSATRVGNRIVLSPARAVRTSSLASMIEYVGQKVGYLRFVLREQMGGKDIPADVDLESKVQPFKLLPAFRMKKEVVDGKTRLVPMFTPEEAEQVLVNEVTLAEVWRDVRRGTDEAKRRALGLDGQTDADTVKKRMVDAETVYQRVFGKDGTSGYWPVAVKFAQRFGVHVRTAAAATADALPLVSELQSFEYTRGTRRLPSGDVVVHVDLDRDSDYETSVLDTVIRTYLERNRNQFGILLGRKTGENEEVFGPNRAAFVNMVKQSVLLLDHMVRDAELAGKPKMATALRRVQEYICPPGASTEVLRSANLAFLVREVVFDASARAIATHRLVNPLASAAAAFARVARTSPHYLAFWAAVNQALGGETLGQYGEIREPKEGEPPARLRGVDRILNEFYGAQDGITPVAGALDAIVPDGMSLDQFAEAVNKALSEAGSGSSVPDVRRSVAGKRDMRQFISDVLSALKDDGATDVISKLTDVMKSALKKAGDFKLKSKFSETMLADLDALGKNWRAKSVQVATLTSSLNKALNDLKEAQARLESTKKSLAAESQRADEASTALGSTEALLLERQKLAVQQARALVRTAMALPEKHPTYVTLRPELDEKGVPTADALVRAAAFAGEPDAEWIRDVAGQVEPSVEEEAGPEAAEEEAEEDEDEADAGDYADIDQKNIQIRDDLASADTGMSEQARSFIVVTAAGLRPALTEAGADPAAIEQAVNDFLDRYFPLVTEEDRAAIVRQAVQDSAKGGARKLTYQSSGSVSAFDKASTAAATAAERKGEDKPSYLGDHALEDLNALSPFVEMMTVLNPAYARSYQQFANETRRRLIELASSVPESGETRARAEARKLAKRLIPVFSPRFNAYNLDGRGSVYGVSAQFELAKEILAEERSDRKISKTFSADDGGTPVDAALAVTFGFLGRVTDTSALKMLETMTQCSEAGTVTAAYDSDVSVENVVDEDTAEIAGTVRTTKKNGLITIRNSYGDSWRASPAFAEGLFADMMRDEEWLSRLNEAADALSFGANGTVLSDATAKLFSGLARPLPWDKSTVGTGSYRSEVNINVFRHNAGIIANAFDKLFGAGNTISLILRSESLYSGLYRRAADGSADFYEHGFDVMLEDFSPHAASGVEYIPRIVFNLGSALGRLRSRALAVSDASLRDPSAPKLTRDVFMRIAREELREFMSFGHPEEGAIHMASAQADVSTAWQALFGQYMQNLPRTVVAADADFGSLSLDSSSVAVTMRGAIPALARWVETDKDPKNPMSFRNLVRSIVEADVLRAAVGSVPVQRSLRDLLTANGSDPKQSPAEKISAVRKATDARIIELASEILARHGDTSVPTYQKALDVVARNCVQTMRWPDRASTPIVSRSLSTRLDPNEVLEACRTRFGNLMRGSVYDAKDLTEAEDNEKTYGPGVKFGPQQGPLLTHELGRVRYVQMPLYSGEHSTTNLINIPVTVSFVDSAAYAGVRTETVDGKPTKTVTPISTEAGGYAWCIGNTDGKGGIGTTRTKDGSVVAWYSPDTKAARLGYPESKFDEAFTKFADAIDLSSLNTDMKRSALSSATSLWVPTFGCELSAPDPADPSATRLAKFGSHTVHLAHSEAKEARGWTEDEKAASGEMIPRSNEALIGTTVTFGATEANQRAIAADGDRDGSKPHMLGTAGESYMFIKTAQILARNGGAQFGRGTVMRRLCQYVARHENPLNGHTVTDEDSYKVGPLTSKSYEVSWTAAGGRKEQGNLLKFILDVVKNSGAFDKAAGMDLSGFKAAVAAYAPDATLTEATPRGPQSGALFAQDGESLFERLLPGLRIDDMPEMDKGADGKGQTYDISYDASQMVCMIAANIAKPASEEWGHNQVNFTADMLNMAMHQLGTRTGSEVAARDLIDVLTLWGCLSPATFADENTIDAELSDEPRLAALRSNRADPGGYEYQDLRAKVIAKRLRKDLLTPMNGMHAMLASCGAVLADDGKTVLDYNTNLTRRDIHRGSVVFGSSEDAKFYKAKRRLALCEVNDRSTRFRYGMFLDESRFHDGIRELGDIGVLAALGTADASFAPARVLQTIPLATDKDIVSALDVLFTLLRESELDRAGQRKNLSRKIRDMLAHCFKDHHGRYLDDPANKVFKKIRSKDGSVTKVETTRVSEMSFDDLFMKGPDGKLAFDRTAVWAEDDRITLDAEKNPGDEDTADQGKHIFLAGSMFFLPRTPSYNGSNWLQFVRASLPVRENETATGSWTVDDNAFVSPDPFTLKILGCDHDGDEAHLAMYAYSVSDLVARDDIDDVLAELRRVVFGGTSDVTLDMILDADAAGRRSDVRDAAVRLGIAKVDADGTMAIDPAMRRAVNNRYLRDLAALAMNLEVPDGDDARPFYGKTSNESNETRFVPFNDAETYWTGPEDGTPGPVEPLVSYMPGPLVGAGRNIRSVRVQTAVSDSAQKTDAARGIVVSAVLALHYAHMSGCFNRKLVSRKSSDGKRDITGQNVYGLFGVDVTPSNWWGVARLWDQFIHHCDGLSNMTFDDLKVQICARFNLTPEMTDVLFTDILNYKDADGNHVLPTTDDQWYDLLVKFVTRARYATYEEDGKGGMRDVPVLKVPDAGLAAATLDPSADISRFVMSKVLDRSGVDYGTEWTRLVQSTVFGAKGAGRSRFAALLRYLGLRLAETEDDGPSRLEVDLDNPSPLRRAIGGILLETYADASADERERLGTPALMSALAAACDQNGNTDLSAYLMWILGTAISDESGARTLGGSRLGQDAKKTLDEEFLSTQLSEFRDYAATRRAWKAAKSFANAVRFQKTDPANPDAVNVMEDAETTFADVMRRNFSGLNEDQKNLLYMSRMASSMAFRGTRLGAATKESIGLNTIRLAGTPAASDGTLAKDVSDHFKAMGQKELADDLYDIYSLGMRARPVDGSPDYARNAVGQLPYIPTAIGMLPRIDAENLMSGTDEYENRRQYLAALAAGGGQVSGLGLANSIDSMYVVFYALLASSKARSEFGDALFLRALRDRKYSSADDQADRRGDQDLFRRGRKGDWQRPYWVRIVPRWQSRGRDMHVAIGDAVDRISRGALDGAVRQHIFLESDKATAGTARDFRLSFDNLIALVAEYVIGEGADKDVKSFRHRRLVSRPFVLECAMTVFDSLASVARAARPGDKQLSDGLNVLREQMAALTQGLDKSTGKIPPSLASAHNVLDASLLMRGGIAQLLGPAAQDVLKQVSISPSDLYGTLIPLSAIVTAPVVAAPSFSANSASVVTILGDFYPNLSFGQARSKEHMRTLLAQETGNGAKDVSAVPDPAEYVSAFSFAPVDRTRLEDRLTDLYIARRRRLIDEGKIDAPEHDMTDDDSPEGRSKYSDIVKKAMSNILSNIPELPDVSGTRRVRMKDDSPVLVTAAELGLDDISSLVRGRQPANRYVQDIFAHDGVLFKVARAQARAGSVVDKYNGRASDVERERQERAAEYEDTVNPMAQSQGGETATENARRIASRFRRALDVMNDPDTTVIAEGDTVTIIRRAKGASGESISRDVAVDDKTTVKTSGIQTVVRIDVGSVPKGKLDLNSSSTALSFTNALRREGIMDITPEMFLLLTEDERRLLVGYYAPGMLTYNAPFTTRDPSWTIDGHGLLTLVQGISLNGDMSEQTQYHEYFHAVVGMMRSVGLFSEQDTKDLARIFGAARGPGEMFDEERAADRFSAYVKNVREGALSKRRRPKGKEYKERGFFRRLYEFIGDMLAAFGSGRPFTYGRGADIDGVHVSGDEVLFDLVLTGRVVEAGTDRSAVKGSLRAAHRIRSSVSDDLGDAARSAYAAWDALQDADRRMDEANVRTTSDPLAQSGFAEGLAKASAKLRKRVQALTEELAARTEDLVKGYATASPLRLAAAIRALAAARAEVLGLSLPEPPARPGRDAPAHDELLSALTAKDDASYEIAMNSVVGFDALEQRRHSLLIGNRIARMIKGGAKNLQPDEMRQILEDMGSGKTSYALSDPASRSGPAPDVVRRGLDLAAFSLGVSADWRDRQDMKAIDRKTGLSYADLTYRYAMEYYDIVSDLVRRQAIGTNGLKPIGDFIPVKKRFASDKDVASGIAVAGYLGFGEVAKTGLDGLEDLIWAANVNGNVREAKALSHMFVCVRRVVRNGTKDHVRQKDESQMKAFLSGIRYNDETDKFEFGDIDRSTDPDAALALRDMYDLDSDQIQAGLKLATNTFYTVAAAKKFCRDLGIIPDSATRVTRERSVHKDATQQSTGAQVPFGLRLSDVRDRYGLTFRQAPVDPISFLDLAQALGVSRDDLLEDAPLFGPEDTLGAALDFPMQSMIRHLPASVRGLAPREILGKENRKTTALVNEARRKQQWYDTLLGLSMYPGRPLQRVQRRKTRFTFDNGARMGEEREFDMVDARSWVGGGTGVFGTSMFAEPFTLEHQRQSDWYAKMIGFKMAGLTHVITGADRLYVTDDDVFETPDEQIDRKAAERVMVQNNVHVPERDYATAARHHWTKDDFAPSVVLGLYNKSSVGSGNELPSWVIALADILENVPEYYLFGKDPESKTGGYYWELAETLADAFNSTAEARQLEASLRKKLKPGAKLDKAFVVNVTDRVLTALERKDFAMPRAGREGKAREGVLTMPNQMIEDMFFGKTAADKSDAFRLLEAAGRTKDMLKSDVIAADLRSTWNKAKEYAAASPWMTDGLGRALNGFGSLLPFFKGSGVFQFYANQTRLEDTKSYEGRRSEYEDSYLKTLLAVKAAREAGKTAHSTMHQTRLLHSLFGIKDDLWAFHGDLLKGEYAKGTEKSRMTGLEIDGAEAEDMAAVAHVIYLRWMEIAFDEADRHAREVKLAGGKAAVARMKDLYEHLAGDGYAIGGLGMNADQMYRMHGVLPANYTAMHHVTTAVNELATTVQFRNSIVNFMLTPVTTATGTAPMCIARPRTLEPGETPMDGIPDEVWEHLARDWAAKAGIAYDASKTGRENAAAVYDYVAAHAPVNGKGRVVAGRTYQDIAPEDLANVPSISGFMVISDDVLLDSANSRAGWFGSVGEAHGYAKLLFNIPRVIGDTSKLAGLAKVASWAKTMNVQASLFFPWATRIESPIGAVGFLATVASNVPGTKLAATAIDKTLESMSKILGIDKLGLGYVGALGENFVRVRDLLPLLDSNDPYMLELEKNASLIGLTLSHRLSNPMEPDKAQVSQKLSDMADFVRRHYGEKQAAWTNAVLRGLFEKSGERAFTYALNATKLAVTCQIAEKVRKRCAAMNRTFDFRKALRPYADYINAEIGGIDPMRYAWANASFRRAMKLGMFSWEWTKGAWTAGGGELLEEAMFGGHLTTPEQRGLLWGRWMRMYGEIMFGLPALVQLASFLVGKIAGTLDPDDKWWIGDNEEHAKESWSADITPLLRAFSKSPLLAGWRRRPWLGGFLIPGSNPEDADRNVRRTYVHAGKQGHEFVGWKDFGKSLTGKLSSNLRSLLEIVLGYDLANPDYAGSMKDQDLVQRLFNFGPDGALMTLTGGFSPFSVSGIRQNRNAGVIAMVWPVLRGMSRTRAEKELDDTLTRWAENDRSGYRYGESVGTYWSGTGENLGRLLPHVRHIVDDMNRNGIDGAAALALSAGRVLSKYCFKLYKEVPKLAGEDYDKKALEKAARSAHRLGIVQTQAAQKVKSFTASEFGNQRIPNTSLNDKWRSVSAERRVSAETAFLGALARPDFDETRRQRLFLAHPDAVQALEEARNRPGPKPFDY